MNQEKNQTSEEKAALVLKEVYQKVEDKSVDKTINSDEALSAEETAEQIKGSDADVDPNVGYDAHPDAEESADQIKGSDADVDKNT